MENKNKDREIEIAMYFAKKEIEEDRRSSLKKFLDRIKHDFKVLQERISPL